MGGQQESWRWSTGSGNASTQQLWLEKRRCLDSLLQDHLLAAQFRHRWSQWDISIMFIHFLSISFYMLQDALRHCPLALEKASEARQRGIRPCVTLSCLLSMRILRTWQFGFYPSVLLLLYVVIACYCCCCCCCCCCGGGGVQVLGKLGVVWETWGSAISSFALPPSSSATPEDIWVADKISGRLN